MELDQEATTEAPENGGRRGGGCGQVISVHTILRRNKGVKVLKEEYGRVASSEEQSLRP